MVEPPRLRLRRVKVFEARDEPFAQLLRQPRVPVRHHLLAQLVVLVVGRSDPARTMAAASRPSLSYHPIVVAVGNAVGRAVAVAVAVGGVKQVRLVELRLSYE